MARDQGTLNLGKGAAFDKSRFKRLRQEDDAWEADFRALPKPLMENETHHLGLVVKKRGGSTLAEMQVEGRPSVNDMATLLANAMKQPLTGGAHRPRRILVRKNPRWQPLFPHLEEIGVEVVVQSDLPKVKEAYRDYLRKMQEARRVGMVKPSADQATVEKLFPAITRWVNGHGHVEIGDQEGFGFVVRALDYGGLIFEDDKPETLAEAMVVLENGLSKYFKEEGIACP